MFGRWIEFYPGLNVNSNRAYIGIVSQDQTANEN